MTVSVTGAELFYSTRGNGPTCLVLSAIGTRPYERQTPPELSDRLRLVYVDLRGGGRSTGEPSDLTFDALATTWRPSEAISASRRSPSWGTPSSACWRSSTAGAAPQAYRT